MTHINHFRNADELIEHLRVVLPDVDLLMVQNYLGFLSVAVVAVYEQAIKHIFTEFSEKKHKVFGEYARSNFRRINGKIGIDTLKNDYVKKFGEKYFKKFNALLKQESDKLLLEQRRDLVNSYKNIITWRNEYAHASRFPTNATFSEVISAYEDGKIVIECLSKAMHR